MKIAIQLGLLIAAGVLAYFIYDGIQEKIEFRNNAEKRREVVQERLERIVTAQKEFKNEKGSYAKSFDELINFLENDSLTIVKAIGNVPDSLTEKEAIERGIVIRDTTQVPAATIFDQEELDVRELRYIPFTEKKEFKLQAGEIVKNKVNVQVFEASAKLGDIYSGLNTENENVDPDDVLKVGSMSEPITTGNW